MGLWDTFQLAVSWLRNGGDPITTYDTWGPILLAPGHLASFGFGPKALFLLLGSVAEENPAQNPEEEDVVPPASKRPRNEATEVQKLMEIDGFLKVLNFQWKIRDEMKIERIDI